MATPAFPPIPVGAALFLFFVTVTIYLMTFSRGMDLRGRVVLLMTATMSFIFGIVPWKYVWLNTDGTLGSASAFLVQTDVEYQGIFIFVTGMLIYATVIFGEWLYAYKTQPGEED